MKKEERGTFTPNIQLNQNALLELKGLFKYTSLLKDLQQEIHFDSDYNGIFLKLKTDLPLQHAIIFSLKAIGVCIDNSVREIEQNIERMPLFWKSIHYLRNSLIHHLPATSLPDKELKHLAVSLKTLVKFLLTSREWSITVTRILILEDKGLKFL